MNNDVIITCAVTGSGETQDKHPELPITPAQIADAAIAAAEAGAAITHIHVRDPETGKAARDPALYREVVQRMRASDTDVVINLTAGMGGDWVPGEDDPAVGGPGTDMARPEERLEHVRELLPEICSLDCGTMNYAGAAYINTPEYLRAMAAIVKDCGVKPELECFETGHIWFANQLVEEGLVEAPPLFQLCLGIPWGAPADPGVLKTMCDTLPAGANWSGFAISRLEMPYVAQAVLMGGNVRVGLEDNLYLSRGVFASNAQLVERARQIVELMGARVLGPAEARDKFGLRQRN